MAKSISTQTARLYHAEHDPLHYNVDTGLHRPVRDWALDTYWVGPATPDRRKETSPASDTVTPRGNGTTTHCGFRC